MAKEEKSSGGEESGKTFGSGQITEEVIDMVKKSVEVVEGESGEEKSDSKHNPGKSVGKELLKRVRGFKEKES